MANQRKKERSVNQNNAPPPLRDDTKTGFFLRGAPILWEGTKYELPYKTPAWQAKHGKNSGRIGQRFLDRQEVCFSCTRSRQLVELTVHRIRPGSLGGQGKSSDRKKIGRSPSFPHFPFSIQFYPAFLPPSPQWRACSQATFKFHGRHCSICSNRRIASWLQCSLIMLWQIETLWVSSCSQCSSYSCCSYCTSKCRLSSNIETMKWPSSESQWQVLIAPGDIEENRYKAYKKNETQTVGNLVP